MNPTFPLPAATGPPDDAGPGSRTFRDRQTVLMLLLSAAILSLLLIFNDSLVSLPLVRLCQVVSAVTIALGAIVFAGSTRGVWSAPFSYVAVFWLFHFGLVFGYAIGAPLIEDEARRLYSWFFQPQAGQAIVSSCVGVAACAVGVYAAMAARKWRHYYLHPAAAGIAEADEGRLRAAFSVAGFGCVAVSIAVWLAIALLSGGPSLIVSDYLTWLHATTGMPTIWVYYGLGMGMSLLGLGARGGFRTSAFVIFCAWAIVAFPLGLRGEVLFPLTTTLMVMARRRIPISTAKVAVLSLFLLVAIAVVRDLRLQGVRRAGSASSSVTGNPLQALAEMGSSLRPVKEVVAWTDAGEEFLYGGSYWAPFERALTRVLPLWKRLPADEDERVLNEVVMQRVGGIGFSVVAEAYRNFGPFGVPAVMLLLGALLGWVESWPGTAVRGAVLGVIFVELLFMIRNDFIAVPMHVIGGFCLVLFTRFVASYGVRGGGSQPGDIRQAGAGSDPLAAGWDLGRGGAAKPRPAWGLRRWMGRQDDPPNGSRG